MALPSLIACVHAPATGAGAVACVRIPGGALPAVPLPPATEDGFWDAVRRACPQPPDVLAVETTDRAKHSRPPPGVLGLFPFPTGRHDADQLAAWVAGLADTGALAEELERARARRERRERRLGKRPRRAGPVATVPRPAPVDLFVARVADTVRDAVRQEHAERPLQLFRRFFAALVHYDTPARRRYLAGALEVHVGAALPPASVARDTLDRFVRHVDPPQPADGPGRAVLLDWCRAGTADPGALTAAVDVAESLHHTFAH